MFSVSGSPPRVPPIKYTAPHGTRWEKEKAASSRDAFEFPEDPKYIGPWIIGECVGKGASGRVKIAKHRRTGQLAAVKILPLQPLLNSRSSLATQQTKSDKQRLGVDREIIMMKLMNHPNIMRIYDVFEGDKELYLVLEYVEGGELFDYLVNRGRLPPLEALAYFKQIVYGLNYAHTFSIIHRDLKPENILIHSLKPPLIKIADWGMAAFAPPAVELETSCGSPHYASPEIVNGFKYEGGATDIWSCGVILYALLTGRLPFDDKNVKTLLAKVKLGRYEIPHNVDPQAKDLLTRMLVVDVSTRITIPEILAHPWLQNPTPGVDRVLAPPVHDLARPLRSLRHIDRDLLESLRVIWGRHGNTENIKADLLSPAGEGTFAKTFYFLLQQYREGTLEENGIVNDVPEEAFFGPAKIIMKQYARPFVKSSIHLNVDANFDPNRTPRITSRDISPSRSTSASSSVLSPPSPGRTPRIRAPSPMGPRPIKSRPMSSPVPPPMNMDLRYSVDAPMIGPSSEIMGASRPRSSTLAAPSHAMEYENISRHVQDPRMSAFSNFGASTVPFPVAPFTSPMSPFVHMGTTQPTPSLQSGFVYSPVPLPALSLQHPLPMLSAPRTEDPNVQKVIDDIADRVNELTARENQEIAQRNSQVVYQPDPPYPDMDWVHLNHPGNTSISGVASGPKTTHRNRGKDKENGPATGYMLPEKGPLPTVNGLGFSKPQQRAVMGREMGNIIYVGDSVSTEQPSKERKPKKHRPPTLDFHARGPNSKRSTIFSIGSPVLSPPPVSSIIGSPAIEEFKGWFSNLFNWKAQSYFLHSNNDVHTTRNEVTRLLERFGAVVAVEDAEGWGMLRCRIDDGIDSLRPVQKQARFRVEFSLTPSETGMFYPLTGATSPRIPLFNPLSPNPGFANRPTANDSTCTIMLVQEKGSVTTFRAVYRRLREEWRLDALQSPTMGPTPLMEHVHETMT